MTMKRYIGFGLIAASLGLLSGCNQIDVSTQEGLLEALEKQEKLDKAIPKISGMVTRPDELAPFVPALIKLYEKGTSFDRDVIEALAASGKREAEPSLRKAVKSGDAKQLMQAAYGAKKLGSNQILNDLIQVFDTQNPEVKRVVLEAGATITSPEIKDKAVEILNGNVDETPFSLLRASCDVLAFQADDSTIDTVMKVVYHQDGVGRTLSTNCTRALLSLSKTVVAPALLKAYKLENEDLMKYVDAHPDTLTPETIRNNTANALALYRHKDAIKPMLDYLGDIKTIPVPGTLAIRPETDPAWAMWASLVGVASQSTIFALNDIGIRDNEDAKRILTDIFNWTVDYQSKFKDAIDLTGTTMIEVSQRVNAYRALRENDLISTEESLKMIESLKGQEFQDERTYRTFARSNMGTDMVTYNAITAKKGDLDTIWAAFNAMKENEFNVPIPEDPEAKRPPHYNDNVSKRIDDVKPAFELAEECDLTYGCYANVLSEYITKVKERETKLAEARAAAKEKGEKLDMSQFPEVEKMNPYVRIKAIYELGFSGQHEYFSLICDHYKYLDSFSIQYGTKALAQLATADDIETIKSMAENIEMLDSKQTSVARTSLEGLVTTVKAK